MAKKRGNYDILSGHVRYVPGVSGMFILLGWLLVGSFIGSAILAVYSLVTKTPLDTEYGMLLSYPVMFIPAILYVRTKSMMAPIDMPGIAIDSNHFGKMGIWGCAGLVTVATLAASYCSDGLTALMPKMPAWLESTLSSMTQGNVIVDFISVSIFAPVFEEWLCRGMVLRGLLNYEKPADKKNIKPVWAIVISAAFFALIHMNPWQAVPAFLLGCLFGYVYYKTGSLKLTMLMHFTNNTFALIMSHIPALEDKETLLDVFSPLEYCAGVVACVIIIALVVKAFRSIPLERPQGNCDVLTDIL